MLMVIPCPRCRHPLDIPKPAPEQVRCGACGAVIKNASGKLPLKALVVPLDQALYQGKPVPVAAFAPAPTPRGEVLRTPRVPEPGSPPRGNRGLVIGIVAGVLLLTVAGLILLLSNISFILSGPAQTQPTTPPIGIDLKTHPSESAKKRPNPGKKRSNPLDDPQVKKAVDAGVAYLRKRLPITPDRNAGEVALMGLTLLECQVPATHPDIQELAKLIRFNASNMTTTYSAAPTIMFLDRLHKDDQLKQTTETDRDRQIREEDRKHIRMLALRLATGQIPSQYIWGYVIPKLDEQEEEKLLSALRGNFENIQGRGREGGDLSNSQFAALGLWVAHNKYDMPVTGPLQKTGELLRNRQNDDGSWSYQPGSTRLHIDSGTCAGLILLALSRAVADETQAESFRKDPVVVKALDHLDKVIKKNKIETTTVNGTEEKKVPQLGKPSNGNTYGLFDAYGDLYFLWALERMAVILDLEKIGDEDWHSWGTQIILASQKGDGRWSELPDPARDVPGTCFALLFLMRANLFPELTDKLELALGSQPSLDLAYSGPPATPSRIEW